VIQDFQAKLPAIQREHQIRTDLAVAIRLREQHVEDLLNKHVAQNQQTDAKQQQLETALKVEQAKSADLAHQLQQSNTHLTTAQQKMQHMETQLADFQKVMLQMQALMKPLIPAASPLAITSASAFSFFSSSSAGAAGSSEGLALMTESKGESKGDSKGALLEEKKDTWQVRVKQEFNNMKYDSAIAIVKTAYAVRDGHSEAELDWQDVHKVCEAFDKGEEGDGLFSTFCKPDLVKKIAQYYQAFRAGEKEAMRAIYYLAPSDWGNELPWLDLLKQLQSPHCKLTSINLMHNKIGDAGAKALAQAVVNLKAKGKAISIRGVNEFEKYLEEATQQETKNDRSHSMSLHS